MKIEVNLYDEQLDELIVKALTNQLEILEDDLADIKAFGPANIFSNNKKEDKRIIKEHIKALKLIIDYNTY